MDKNMNVSYSGPVLFGEFRGCTDDTFEFADKRHDNQIKKLYKRVYAIETCGSDGGVNQVPCEQITNVPLAPCKLKRGDMVVVHVTAYSVVNGRSRCSCNAVELR